MRISDWSSDVCSSDLGDGHAPDVYGRLLRSGLTEGRSMAKLPSGELENQVLGVLWANGGALTPRDVHDALGAARGLPYPTTMTILGRLWRKGLLERARSGRSHAYRPNTPPEQRAASRLNIGRPSWRERVCQ